MISNDFLPINNEHDFDRLVEHVTTLLNKGTEHLSEHELAEIQLLSLAAHEYEQKKYTIDDPTTLSGIIEWIMYKQRIQKKEMAKGLGISFKNLTSILGGTKKPDVQLLKSLHEKYGVNAEQLIRAI